MIVLSSKDHPTLVIGALQLVELLSKIPKEYRPAFRREGVFHEVELLADRTLTSSKKKKGSSSDKDKDKDLSDASCVASSGSRAAATAAPSGPTLVEPDRKSGSAFRCLETLNASGRVRTGTKRPGAGH
jgi:E3 ubiquitin-protein ligase TRIP12